MIAGAAADCDSRVQRRWLLPENGIRDRRRRRKDRDRRVERGTPSLVARALGGARGDVHVDVKLVLLGQLQVVAALGLLGLHPQQEAQDVVVGRRARLLAQLVGADFLLRRPELVEEGAGADDLSARSFLPATFISISARFIAVGPVPAFWR